MLDKVVFIADKIEKKKDYPGVDILRKLAYVDIDKCLISYLEKSDLYLKSLGKKLHGDSVKLLIRLEEDLKKWCCYIENFMIQYEYFLEV